MNIFICQYIQILIIMKRIINDYSKSAFYLADFSKAERRAVFSIPPNVKCDLIYYFPHSHRYVHLAMYDKNGINDIENVDGWLGICILELFKDDQSVYDYLIRVNHADLVPTVLPHIFDHLNEEK